MTWPHRRRGFWDPSPLWPYEGRTVSLALVDGSRIDDCQLVSVCRSEAHTLWLFVNGSDVFVPLNQVLEVWDPDFPQVGAAAG